MSATVTSNSTDQTDPIIAPASMLPLGRPVGSIPISDAAPSRVRPFGLRYAVVPAETISVDLAALRYDTDRQISVSATGTPIYDKHSTGQTSTQTSDGHQSMDSDTDYTED
jgi:putative ATP-grasp target RiPP